MSVIVSRIVAGRIAVPIKLRLAILFSLGTAVIFIIGSFFFRYQISTGLQSSLAADLRAKGYILSQNISVGQQSGPTGNSSTQDVPSNLNGPDSNTTEVQLPGLPFSVAAPNSSVLAAQVLNGNGSVLESFGIPATSPLLGTSQVRVASNHELIVKKDLLAKPVLLLAEPIPDSGGQVVVVGASLTGVNASVERVTVELALFGVFLMLIAGLVAWVLSGAALAPVSKMRRQVEEIFELGQWSSLEVPQTKDEVAHLAMTLSELLRRLEESMSRQRGFVAVAGHELRTPLAILKGELELAQKSNRSELELRSAVAAALEETERLIRLSEHLLLLARKDEGVAIANLEMREVFPLLAHTVDDFSGLAKDREISINLVCDESVICEVDELALRQITANLIDNSLRYAPPGSAIEVTCVYQKRSVVLRISDEGPGFPDDFLPIAFERFSRADEHRDRAHGGSGLGLAIVKSLVEAMGGKIWASNRASGGAQVEVKFPTPDFINSRE